MTIYPSPPCIAQNAPVAHSITEEMVIAQNESLQAAIDNVGAGIDRLRASHDRLLAAATHYLGSTDMTWRDREESKRSLQAAIAAAEDLAP